MVWERVQFFFLPFIYSHHKVFKISIWNRSFPYEVLKTMREICHSIAQYSDWSVKYVISSEVMKIGMCKLLTSWNIILMRKIGNLLYKVFKISMCPFFMKYMNIWPFSSLTICFYTHLGTRIRPNWIQIKTQSTILHQLKK